MALENHLTVRFHWNEARDARNPKGNKAGADLIGFIEISGDVLFLFGEVKTSSETITRPPQVMTGGDQMEEQLRNLYLDLNKRKLLIRYLANKTRNLENSHPFKDDYRKALRCYYLHDHPNYQLVGVLVRDVEPDESDLMSSYQRLENLVLNPKGIKLIACYIPIAKDEWNNMIRKDKSK